MGTLKDQYDSCLYHASAALVRHLTKLANEQFHAFDLSPTQGFILLTVRKTPGINVTDLAMVLSLDQSTITKTLDKMEFKGLVQRESIERNTRIFLTGKGEEREADAKAAWKKLRAAYTLPMGTGVVRHVADELVKARRTLVGEEE